METTLPTVTFLTLILISAAMLTGNASFQTPDQSIPPRQQWRQANDISQISCATGLVLIQKVNGAPACVSPDAYLRLVDRGWGMWDPTIMSNRPNMMQGVIDQAIRDPVLSKHLHSMAQQEKTLWYDVSPQLKQQLQEDSQILQSTMMPIMNDPQLRQQMIEMMQQSPQIMQSIRNNNMMMQMIQGSIPLPSNQTGMTGTTGDLVMSKGLKGSMMENQGKMRDQTMGQNMMGQMMEWGMMMHNPQMMQNMMVQMMNDPQMRAMMQSMMIQNPHHRQSMVNQGMAGPMVGSMINDPQLREQMLDMMMQHQDMMMSLRQNQQFLNSLNQP